MAKPLSPIETFLTPLAKLTTRHPDLEGAVIWAAGTDWQAQEDAEALLDAEEIPFYAEGLLLEGFHMQWQALAETEAPKDPVHIRLFFWQGTATPPPPEPGFVLLASGAWTG